MGDAQSIQFAPGVSINESAAVQPAKKQKKQTQKPTEVIMRNLRKSKASQSNEIPPSLPADDGPPLSPSRVNEVSINDSAAVQPAKKQKKETQKSLKPTEVIMRNLRKSKASQSNEIPPSLPADDGPPLSPSRVNEVSINDSAAVQPAKKQKKETQKSLKPTEVITRNLRKRKASQSNEIPPSLPADDGPPVSPSPNNEFSNPSPSTSNSLSSKEDRRVKKEPLMPNKKAMIRTSAIQIFFVIKNLNEEQRISVEEMGFGGLMKLRTSGNIPQLITYLLEKFNWSRCSFKFDKFSEMFLDEGDVESIFDLPRGQKSVLEALERIDDDDYSTLVDDYKKRWNVRDAGALTTTMSSEMLNRQDSGDDFKRDFIVLVHTALFRSHQGRKANYKILKVLNDLNDLKNYNWCYYLIECLISTVKKWRTSESKHKFFAGPGLFMMLCYVDRMEFMQRKENSREFPVCSNWKSCDIMTRVKYEIELGGLGQGKVVERLKRPTEHKEVEPEKSKVHQLEKLRKDTREEGGQKDREGERLEEDTEQQRGQNDKERGQMDTEEEGQKDTKEKLKNVLKKMTGAVNEFRTVMDDMGKEPHFTNEILMTPFDLILNEKEKEKQGTPKDPTPKDPTPKESAPKEKSMLDDSLFEDEELVNELFALWDIFLVPQKVAKIPVSDGKSPRSYSLGLEDISPMGVDGEMNGGDDVSDGNTDMIEIVTIPSTVESNECKEIVVYENNEFIDVDPTIQSNEELFKEVDRIADLYHRLGKEAEEEEDKNKEAEEEPIPADKNIGEGIEDIILVPTPTMPIFEADFNGDPC
ncbi:hypothetical protein CASFOL_042738 [Castilleja foliolosa]|uniref:Uncharacterized protein n=1 Tax=Castilleja foliolosa TaxID=1961234 RepID=A0ABD3B7Y0_9LAMI